MYPALLQTPTGRVPGTRQYQAPRQPLLSQVLTFSTRFPGRRLSTKCRRFSRTTALWKKEIFPFMIPRIEGVLCAPRWWARRLSYPAWTTPIPTPEKYGRLTWRFLMSFIKVEEMPLSSFLVWHWNSDLPGGASDTCPPLSIPTALVQASGCYLARAGDLLASMPRFYHLSSTSFKS